MHAARLIGALSLTFVRPRWRSRSTEREEDRTEGDDLARAASVLGHLHVPPSAHLREGDPAGRGRRHFIRRSSRVPSCLCDPPSPLLGCTAHSSSLPPFARLIRCLRASTRTTQPEYRKWLATETLPYLMAQRESSFPRVNLEDMFARLYMVKFCADFGTLTR